MIEILTPDFKFGDERGVLIQLVHEGFKQINVITSEADVVRGRHYHELNREAFFIIQGSVQLYVKNGKCESQYVFNTGDMFLIPPLVWHEFSFLSPTQLVSMYDLGVETGGAHKDIYSFKEIRKMMEELINNRSTASRPEFVAWKAHASVCLEVMFGADSEEYKKFIQCNFEPDGIRLMGDCRKILEEHCIKQLEITKKYFPITSE
ncbi:MAG: cupin domain-containing protein [Clostridium sp.]|nr:cupin domain-containing protein [Clostridium sp.]